MNYMMKLVQKILYSKRSELHSEQGINFYTNACPNKMDKHNIFSLFKMQEMQIFESKMQGEVLFQVTPEEESIEAFLQHFLSQPIR